MIQKIAKKRQETSFTLDLSKATILHNVQSTINPTAPDQEDKEAFALFTLIKGKASSDSLIGTAIESYQLGYISRRKAALLIRGALIDFGGGSYNEGSRLTLISLMKKFGKSPFMYREDVNFYNSLSDELTIYRAADEPGLFWTLNKQYVRLFASTHKRRQIFTGTISKEDILFLTIMEGGTIICDPKTVTNLSIETIDLNKML